MATVAERLEDREQLLGGVVREGQRLREAGLEAGVGAHELVHLGGVARRDDDEPVPAVLDQLHDGVDGLAPEVLVAAADEGVRLVDEQHALVGAIEDLDHLGGGLADEAGDQAGPVGLDELAPLDDAEGPVDLRQQPGDGGLAGARVAREDQVSALIGGLEPTLAAQLLDPQQVGDELDLALHGVEPDEIVELVEQLVDGSGRRERLLLRLVRGHRVGGGRGRSGRVGGGRCAVAPGSRLGLGFGGRDGRVGDGLDPALLDGVEQRAPEPLDGEQLVAVRVVVERCGHEAERHRVLVVGGRPAGAVADVRVEQLGEEGRGCLEERPPAGGEAVGAELVGGPVEQRAVLHRCERHDQRPQLLVGGPPIGVHEAQREVVGLLGHAPPDRLAVGRGRTAASGSQRRHDGRQRIDEGVGRHLQSEIDLHGGDRTGRRGGRCRACSTALARVVRGGPRWPVRSRWLPVVRAWRAHRGAR